MGATCPQATTAPDKVTETDQSAKPPTKPMVHRLPPYGDIFCDTKLHAAPDYGMTVRKYPHDFLPFYEGCLPWGQRL